MACMCGSFETFCDNGVGFEDMGGWELVRWKLKCGGGEGQTWPESEQTDPSRP